MTLKTEEDIFFVDHVFCIFKKELMKYVVLEYVHVSPLHYNYFIYISSFGFRPNKMARPVGPDSPPIFAALQWSS
jgi:hypothetical protein